jgi:hypothetical protein
MVMVVMPVVRCGMTPCDSHGLPVPVCFNNNAVARHAVRLVFGCLLAWRFDGTDF